MKKVDMKFVLKGLVYAGLIIMIIIMMMIASSCSAEPKPEMSLSEAANLTDSIREEVSEKIIIQYDHSIDVMTIANMETAAAADNFMSDKIGSYVLLTGIDDLYFASGIEDAGFTVSFYADGSTFTLNTDLGFIDVVENGYTSLYGYLAKEKNVDSSYILVGCFPATAEGSVDTGFFGTGGEATPVDETANSSNTVVEETTATVDPELTDPSTRPSDLSKCFTIDMFAQAERTTMNLLEEHVGQWVHLTNLYASMNDGSAYMYAYVGSENWDMDGEGTLQVAGEGGYLNIALADGMTNEFYGFVGIDGMTREVYIGNVFAANEDTLCSDPTGPDGEPPVSSSTVYVQDDILPNQARFISQHANESIVYEGTVSDIDSDRIILDWYISVYFTNPSEIWNINLNDEVRVEGYISEDMIGYLILEDSTLVY